MVTKYDVFEFMYSHGGAMHPKEVVAAFKKTDKSYKFIYRIITDLVNLRLITKNDYGFEIIRNQKNDLLFHMIKFCIANRINYNDLLDENIAAFISKGFLKKEFTIHDFDLHPRTYSKYVNILAKNGLIITLSKKPLTCLIPYNSFLRDMLYYFGQKAMVARRQQDEYFDEINRELHVFRRLRDANSREYQRIIDDFEIKFIHHSLNLEGNPITLPDTIKLLRDHITPANLNIDNVQEVQNYQKAMHQMILDAQNKRALTEESIKGYHYLAMQHRPRMAGKIRTVPVYIKNNPNFKLTTARDIEQSLKNLLKKYNDFIVNRHELREILGFASYFHNEFQHIHPFEDGNSRITRLITFHFLRVQNVPIFDIPLGMLEQYLDATKGSSKRDDDKLDQTLQLIVLHNLKSINDRLS